MDHQANDALGPIIIKGPGNLTRLLDLVARYKGRTTRTIQSAQVEITDRGLSILGLWPAVEYLEERYPDPAIFPDTPARRAVVRSITTQLIETSDTLAKVRNATHTGPRTKFLLTNDITLLDLAVAAVARSAEWADFVSTVLQEVGVDRDGAAA